MNTNTSTVNLEPFEDDKEGELNSSTGCLIFFGMIILMACLMIGFISMLFNGKML